MFRAKAHVGRALAVAGIAAALLACSAPSAASDTYANGFPTSPDFFPIGVWLQSPRNAPEFHTLGVNTFIGLWHGPTEEQLADLAKNQMFAVAEQNDGALALPSRSVIRAWMQGDEPDNAQSNGHGGYDACIPAAEVAARSAALRARDPSRPVLINFGQGVAYPGWIGRGSKCFGDMGYYGDAAKGAGVLSFDVYPVASDNPALEGKLEFVARGVDALKSRVGARQSVWAIVEASALDSHHLVTPDQLRSEVWLALIHGARGIVYFVHEWTGGFREDGIFRHPEVVDAAARINQTITALAPVLNSPDVAGKVVVSDPAISVMVKIRDGYLYVFAVSTRSTSLKVSFSLPGIGSASASVIDENRALGTQNGGLSDAFGGYGVHLYKIRVGDAH